MPMMWLLWLVIAFILIVVGLFIASQGGRFLGPALGAIGVVILLILAVSPARSHDHNRPDLDSWYPTLRSPAGAPCCVTA